MAFSEKLKTLYQSYPETQFLYKTLQISHSSFADRFLYQTGDSTDQGLTFRDENNVSMPCLPSGFTINEPNNEANANSNVTLSFGVPSLIEVNEIVDAIEADAIKFLEPIEVIYRVYHKSERYAGPSTDPVKYYVESITMDPSTGANLKLTTTNNLQFGTGRIYSITDFPSLITNG